MTPRLDPYGTDPRGFTPEPRRPLPTGHRPTAPAHDETDPRRRDPIRRAIALRLAVAGRRHVRHRNDLAGVPDRRPGPHAMIFLFRGADPHPAAGPRRDTAITVATRMFLDGPDVQHLPDLLTTITDRARDLDREHHRQGRGLTTSDLVGYLTDRIETPPPATRYWGTAVSSIDTTRERSDNPDPMPWDGLVHLIDGTRMSLHTTRQEIPPTSSPPTPSTRPI